jgi:hypothetical protein
MSHLLIKINYYELYLLKNKFEHFNLLVDRDSLKNGNISEVEWRHDSYLFHITHLSSYYNYSDYETKFGLNKEKLTILNATLPVIGQMDISQITLKDDIQKEENNYGFYHIILPEYVQRLKCEHNSEVFFDEAHNYLYNESNK